MVHLDRFLDLASSASTRWHCCTNYKPCDLKLGSRTDNSCRGLQGMRTGKNSSMASHALAYDAPHSMAHQKCDKKQSLMLRSYLTPQYYAVSITMLSDSDSIIEAKRGSWPCGICSPQKCTSSECKAQWYMYYFYRLALDHGEPWWLCDKVWAPKSIIYLLVRLCWYANSALCPTVLWCFNSIPLLQFAYIYIYISFEHKKYCVCIAIPCWSCNYQPRHNFTLIQ